MRSSRARTCMQAQAFPRRVTLRGSRDSRLNDDERACYEDRSVFLEGRREEEEEVWDVEAVVQDYGVIVGIE